MNTKIKYAVGDTVWITGINSTVNRLIEGQIVKSFTIDQKGYDPTTVYYVIAIPTTIDVLLEVRTWETISQDSRGPIGGIRNAVQKVDADRKYLNNAGIFFDDRSNVYEPTEQEILDAIERSKSLAEHPPLVMKTDKPKRRNFTRKKNGQNKMG